MWRWCFILWLVYSYAKPPKVEVPSTITFCGITIHLSKSLRQKIQEEVDNIHKNPLYFRQMVERATLYFPIMKEAFAHIGVPGDLIYISIQESSLRGDAVSSSFAVGYWQLKDFTAEEVGLTINAYVDERKHLFRSSIGAARYFYKQWLRYNNWLYAVIAYYEGGTGAKPYTQSRYYGAKEMYLNDLHWYALRALAHKLAYEPYIPEQPDSVWLQPKPLPPLKSLEELLKQEQISKEAFLQHNPWLLTEQLPQNYPITYYVETHTPYQYVEHPYKALFKPPYFKDLLVQQYWQQSHKVHRKSVSAQRSVKRRHKKVAKKQQRSLAPNPIPPRYLARFPITTAPYYNIEFTVAKPKETLKAIAERFHKRPKRLARWNNLPESYVFQRPQIVLLVPPRKAHIHIVGKYEKLPDIAVRYHVKLSHLLYLNNFHDADTTLFTGQKIYLKEKRPIDEKIIIYTLEEKKKEKTPIVFDTTAILIDTTIAKKDSTQVALTKSPPSREVEIPLTPSLPKRQYYVVQKGDSLWRIAKRFGVSVQQLRRLNHLQSDLIYPGMRLRIR